MTIIDGLNSNPNHTIFIDSDHLRDETETTHHHKWSAMEASMGYSNEAFTGTDVGSLGQTSPWKKNNSYKFFKSDETNVKYIDEATIIENGILHSLESASCSRYPPTAGKRGQDELTGINSSLAKKKKTSVFSDQSLSSDSISKNHSNNVTEKSTEGGTQTEILPNSPLAPIGHLSLVRASSLAYSGAVYATISSALRGLFGGCFRCHCSDTAAAAACLDQTESEQQKGAWFDCGQMQKNKSFSYLNPAIVRSEDDVNQSRQKIPEQRTALTEVASPLEQVEIHPFQTPTMFAELKQRVNTATQNDTTDRPAFLSTGDSTNYGDDESFKSVSVGHVSFATKLEEDHRHREVDIERSEGNSLYALNYETFGGDRTAKWPEILAVVENEHRAVSVQSEELTSKRNSGQSDDIFFGVDSYGFQNEDTCGDVWEDTELEEAFGIYNLNAFYSYGSTSPIVLTSSPSKPVNEKFEEVFPASKPLALRPSTPHEIDVNEQSSLVSVPNHNKEKDSFETDQRKWISEDELNNIIQQFLLLEKDATFSEVFRTYKDNLSCDNYFIFKGRRVTKLLLFDLVNEQRLLCNVHYLSSSLFTNSNFHERVEANVFKVLEVAPERHRRRSKRKAIFDQRKYENGILVNSLIVDTLKKEEFEWSNFDKEELERKKLVCDEIMNDLLLDTANIFKNILKNKALLRTSV